MISRGGRARVGAAVVVLALGAAAPASGSPAEPPVLADGIRLETLDTTLAPGSLTDLTFLPSGDVLATSKQGVIKRITPAGDAVTLASLPVATSVNRGLSSLALADDYARTGAIYTLATYREGSHRVARVERFVVDDVDEPTTMRRRSVVLDDIPADGPGHHTVGDLRVADGGDLLVSLGDGGHPGTPDDRNFRALDPGFPGGKILRVTPTGDGVPGNPFYELATADSWASRVYALGLRNPFRFTIRPDTSALYVGDVGARARETLVVVSAGTNMAWPCFEGGIRREEAAADPRCQTITPTGTVVWSYPDRPPGSARAPGAAIIAGTFPGAGSPWAGQHVFADFARGDVLALPVDADDRVSASSPTVLAHGPWSPVSFALDPSGRVCFADLASARIRCLVPTDGANT